MRWFVLSFLLVQTLQAQRYYWNNPIATFRGEDYYTTGELTSALQAQTSSIASTTWPPWDDRYYPVQAEWPAHISADSLSQVVDYFVRDAYRGHNILFADAGRTIIEYGDPATFGDGVAASAFNSCEAGFHISINPQVWNTLNTGQKMHVLYHELGHGLLHLDHVCNQEEIMSTAPLWARCYDLVWRYRPEWYSWFLTAKDRMFSGAAAKAQLERRDGINPYLSIRRGCDTGIWAKTAPRVKVCDFKIE